MVVRGSRDQAPAAQSGIRWHGERSRATRPFEATAGVSCLMATDPPPANSPGHDELVTKVQAWLNKQGYPLEFRSALALRNAGLDITMGSYFKSGSGQPREVDILCDMSFPNDEERRVRKMRLLVECKYSKYPIVLPSFLAQHGGALNFMSIPRTASLRDAPIDLLQYEKSLLDTFIFSPAVPHAHGIVSAFRENPRNTDAAFNAVRKACSIAWDHVAELDASPVSNKVEFAVFPVVILDAPMFLATLDTRTGDVAARPIDIARVSWGAGSRDSIATIVSAAHVEKFAEWAVRSLRSIGQSVFFPKAHGVVASAGSRPKTT